MEIYRVHYINVWVIEILKLNNEVDFTENRYQVKLTYNKNYEGRGDNF